MKGLYDFPFPSKTILKVSFCNCFHFNRSFNYNKILKNADLFHLLLLRTADVEEYKELYNLKKENDWEIIGKEPYVHSLATGRL